MSNTAMIERRLAQLPKRRFTVAEYHKLGDAGILDEDDRIELIEGELVQMAPIGDLHAGTVNHLIRLFGRLAHEPIVSAQNPIVLGQRSEPQPDFMLLRYRDDLYGTNTPTPRDVLLLIEVADSTIATDRGIKVPLYGQNGVPECWLLDIQRKKLEIYLTPGAPGYEQVLRPDWNETIHPTLLPTVSLRVVDLFLK